MLALHESILSAFAIEAGEMASFYVSDEHWNQLEPIVLVDIDEPTASRMDQLEIGDVLGMEGDRLLYVYDFLRLRTFYVERVHEAEPNGAEGLCATFGELPPPADLDSAHALFDEEVDTDRGFDEYGLESDEFDEDESGEFDPFDQGESHRDPSDESY